MYPSPKIGGKEMLAPEKQPLSTIATHFSELKDPRRACLNDHPLINIITIALCAIIAGAETWTDVASFGQNKQVWLSRFLDLEQGIPSMIPLDGLFARLGYQSNFRPVFVLGTSRFHHDTQGQVIAIDGKKLRHSL